jgi:putative FmdB family regulatory protein
MPVYEYKCESCGREFELFQRISEPEAKTCKFCQGPVRKLISLTTFHLKGSGWYVTDYGGKKAPPVSESDKSEAVKSAPSETKATDTASSTDSGSSSTD